MVINRPFHVVSGRKRPKLYDEFADDLTLIPTAQRAGSWVALIGNSKFVSASPKLPFCGTAWAYLTVASGVPARMAVKVSVEQLAGKVPSVSPGSSDILANE